MALGAYSVPEAHMLKMTLKTKLSWCQLCRHWWHRRLSLWQPTVPPVTTKLALWQLSVFSQCRAHDCATNSGTCQWPPWFDNSRFQAALTGLSLCMTIYCASDAMTVQMYWQVRLQTRYFSLSGWISTTRRSMEQTIQICIYLNISRLEH